jgi:hypothetical protein
MAGKAIAQDLAQTIVANWRTGAYSQQALAEKHKVSKGMVNKLCKGTAQDTAAIVTAGIQYKQGLAAHDDRTVTAVTQVVEERTKHIQFFNTAAIINVSLALEKITAETSQAEHRMLADTILKGKETVLGKTPDTAIQINQSGQGAAKEQVIPDDPIEAARVYQELMGR